MPVEGGSGLILDPLGRRVEVRLWRGWVLSTGVAAAAACVSLFTGGMVGLLAGSQPGWKDTLLMGVVQAVWVVPSVLWAAVLVFLVGRGLAAVVLAIGLSTWTETARLVRVEVQRLWSLPYMEAARALGLPYRVLLFRHLVPNLRSLFGVQFVQTFATAVLIEAGLGFVGFGVAPPHVSLGTLLMEAVGWLTLPQGQMQGVGAGLLLAGTIFAVYSLSYYDRYLI